MQAIAEANKQSQPIQSQPCAPGAGGFRKWPTLGAGLSIHDSNLRSNGYGFSLGILAGQQPLEGLPELAAYREQHLSPDFNLAMFDG